jgi:hypothetical protein
LREEVGACVMNRFDVYIHDHFICTLSARSILHALKKAEEQIWIYNQIIKRLPPGKSIELFIADHNDSRNCMTSLYAYKPVFKQKHSFHADGLIPGFVYRRANHELFCKYLALKQGNQIAYFDGFDVVCTYMGNVNVAFDDFGIATFASDFPHHFDAQYFDTIYEVLTENFDETYAVTY